MSDSVSPVRAPRLVKLKVVCAVLFVAWLALDLWSKAFMQEHLGLVAGHSPSERQVDVIPGFLAWQGTWNPGVTFGLAKGQTYLILALTGVATIALLAWFAGTRSRSKALHVGLGLILAGAIGNLWDRWHWGEVRDFVLIYVGKLDDPTVVRILGFQLLPWPNFNVADAGIVVGVALVLWDALFGLGAREARRHAAARRSAREQGAQ